MADDTPDPTPAPTPAWQARMLLRAARAGTLATSAEGQPFASLVTPACAADMSVLLLLSDLSEHTRHLRADPRCAVLVTGAATGPNPQTAPRVTVTGLAALEPDPTLKSRWLALHPYAALYADFGDFHLWRIQPRGALIVGGFARANRLRQADLLPSADAIGAIAEAEDSIIGHCNADHGDALSVIAQSAGGAPGAWRMVAVDCDGCDLAQGETVLRIHWAGAQPGPGGIRGELVRLARVARGAGSGK